MPPIQPDDALEIARRVHDTFQHAERWHQRGWGRDDLGEDLKFDGWLHVTNDEDEQYPPTLDTPHPHGLRCFCLAGAIRIHTGAVIRADPASLAGIDEEICEIYVAVGRLEKHVAPGTGWEKNLDAIVEWNDEPHRSFNDIRNLTAAVLRHLDTHPS